jgi:Sec-independent protein translocase protein TatA
MEILGIGGAELVAILIIMLIVAGPKRMMQWAYILGKYTAKARAMWAESMSYIQQEMKEAGMDVELPKTPPTRGSINRQIAKALTPVTKPIQEALDETNTQLNEVKKQATITESNGRSLNLPQTPPSPPPDNTQPNLGTWSGSKPVDE